MTGNFVIKNNPEVVQDSTVRLSLGSGGLVLETNIKLRNAKAVLSFQPFGRLPKLMPVTFQIVSRMPCVTPRTLTEQRKLACPHGGRKETAPSDGSETWPRTKRGALLRPLLGGTGSDSGRWGRRASRLTAGRQPSFN